MIKNLPKRQTTNVLSHWYVLFEDMQFSSQEFYKSIETELTARKVPRLRASRVEFLEGSAISDKREYLRLARERYAFDICAAQFGTGYFFSLRFVEKPRSWLQLLVLTILLVVLWNVTSKAVEGVRGGGYWVLGVGAFVAAIWWLLKQQKDATNTPKPATDGAVYNGDSPDLDTFLLNIAVVGDLYERVRTDTYFRHDTQLLFHTLVTDIVKRKVDEMTAAKGVNLLRSFEYSPILGELYQRSTVAAETKIVTPDSHAVS